VQGSYLAVHCGHKSDSLLGHSELKQILLFVECPSVCGRHIRSGLYWVVW